MKKPDKPQNDENNSPEPDAVETPGREDRLARQLRDNLAKRKKQSRARNTRSRKFKNNND
ncbi:MAG: hypothetical protein GY927_17445 [bacterium]|nr:hypothetical protein [bacterium]